MKLFHLLLYGTSCLFISCDKISSDRSAMSDTQQLKFEQGIVNLNTLSDSVINIQDSTTTLEWDSLYVIQVSAHISHELGYVQSTVDVIDAEVHKQNLFLTELKLLRIRGANSFPTGIDVSDTTEEQYSRCLTADPSSTEAQRNFGVMGLRLRPPRFQSLT